MMSSIDTSYNGQIINIFFITKRIKSFILHSVTFFLINAVTFFIIINYSCNSSEAVWHSSIFALKLLSSICFFFPYLWKFSGYTKYTKDTKTPLDAPCIMMNPNTVADVAFYLFFCYQVCTKRFMSCENSHVLFTAMFPDSDVAKKKNYHKSKYNTL